MNFLSSLNLLAPEITLALFAMGALLVAVWSGKDKAASVLIRISAGLLGVIALWIAGQNGAQSAFEGAYVNDAFSRFSKIVILLASALVLLMSRRFFEYRGLLKFEFPILIILCVIGMMIMVSASDLILLYMGLELQSLSLYVVAALNRNNARSTEAGLKYFVLGALSSGILLYGASLIYGYTGSTNFAEIKLVAQSGEMPLGVLLGLVFLLVGLAFKISAVPFHMWTPDVYEGAPTPVTSFFASAPKMAAMALLVRVLYDGFGLAVSDWSQIIALLALLSMFVGAIAAIGQRDIKRLMAYSSISHMGFALIGLATGTQAGLSALLIYMVLYTVMALGTFAFILSMERNGKAVTDISALKQYSKTEPQKALAVLVLMFSLAGIPPFAGFFGKFYILRAAIETGMAWLAIAGVIASVIGAFYYLRIVYYIYFGEEEGGVETPMSPVNWTILVGGAFIMVLGIINLFGIEEPAHLVATALVH